MNMISIVNTTIVYDLNVVVEIVVFVVVVVDPRANMQTERYPKPQQYYKKKGKRPFCIGNTMSEPPLRISY